MCLVKFACKLYSVCIVVVVEQLGDHERALRLLVHKLRDFPAAEKYCFVNSTNADVALRTRLFHTLLSVYLDPSVEWVLVFIIRTVFQRCRAKLVCVV